MACWPTPSVPSCTISAASTSSIRAIAWACSGFTRTAAAARAEPVRLPRRAALSLPRPSRPAGDDAQRAADQLRQRPRRPPSVAVIGPDASAFQLVSQHQPPRPWRPAGMSCSRCALWCPAALRGRAVSLSAALRIETTEGRFEVPLMGQPYPCAISGDKDRPCPTSWLQRARPDLAGWPAGRARPDPPAPSIAQSRPSRSAPARGRGSRRRWPPLSQSRVAPRNGLTRS